MLGGAAPSVGNGAPPSVPAPELPDPEEDDALELEEELVEVPAVPPLEFEAPLVDELPEELAVPVVEPKEEGPLPFDVPQAPTATDTLKKAIRCNRTSMRPLLKCDIHTNKPAASRQTDRSLWREASQSVTDNSTRRVGDYLILTPARPSNARAGSLVPEVRFGRPPA